MERPTENTLRYDLGLQLSITLTDDSWEAGVGIDAAASLALARGLQALQTESYGWNAVVQRSLLDLNTSAVSRVSDTEVLLQLPPQAEYSIAYPETIVFTVPASTINSKQRLIATPVKGVIISAAPSVVTLGGSLFPSAEEAALRELGGSTLIISLEGDDFLPGVAIT